MILRIAILCLATALQAAGNPRQLMDSEADSTILEMAYSAEFFVDVGLGDAQAATEVWSKALMEKWDLPFGTETAIIDDPEAIVEAINCRQIDLVALTPLQYLQIAGRTGIEPVLASSIRDQVSHPLVLLVRRDAGGALADLAGASLAVARAGRGRIGQLWLESALAAAGLPPMASFFGQVRDVSKTAQAVLPVFMGEVGACLVPQDQFATMVELNPQLGRDLTVLAASPPVCQALVCLRPGVAAERRALVVEKMGNMHTESLGRQILTLFRIERLVPYDPSHTEATFALIRGADE